MWQQAEAPHCYLVQQCLPFLEVQARQSLDSSLGPNASPTRPSTGAFSSSAAPLSPRYTSWPERGLELKWRKGVSANVGVVMRRGLLLKQIFSI